MIHRVHERLRGLLAERGAMSTGSEYCAHHPTAGEVPFMDCECRKPSPGCCSGRRARAGDRPRAVLHGRRQRARHGRREAARAPILVLTGYGRGEWEHQQERFSEPRASPGSAGRRPVDPGAENAVTRTAGRKGSDDAELPPTPQRAHALDAPGDGAALGALVPRFRSSRRRPRRSRARRVRVRRDRRVSREAPS